jgi:hypothetical protein
MYTSNYPLARRHVGSVGVHVTSLDVHAHTLCRVVAAVVGGGVVCTALVAVDVVRARARVCVCVNYTPHRSTSDTSARTTSPPPKG